MGQQQLILIILVSIIIGVATIVALNILNNRADKSNREAVRQDLAAAASLVQSIWERPSLMGGANKRFLSIGESKILEYLNIPSSDYQPGDDVVTNVNGTYSVEIISDTELHIIGEPVSGHPKIQISVSRNSDTSIWEFEITEIEEN